MTDKMYEELAIERAIKTQFGLTIDIYRPILFKFPLSRTAQATLFLTEKKQLYLYIDAESKLLLGDVKKLVSRVGLKAETYFPPKGRPDYFDEVGKAKFRDIFPGRGHISDQDILFYRTLAPYTPALILISEIKDGHVYQFDSDANDGWRIGAKFSYRRIRTS
jgi:hypothetical protein